MTRGSRIVENDRTIIAKEVNRVGFMWISGSRSDYNIH